MSPITRGFLGSRREAARSSRVPPGQSLVDDFPVLSAGPTPYTQGPRSGALRARKLHRIWSASPACGAGPRRDRSLTAGGHQRSTRRTGSQMPPERRRAATGEPPIGASLPSSLDLPASAQAAAGPARRSDLNRSEPELACGKQSWPPLGRSLPATRPRTVPRSRAAGSARKQERADDVHRHESARRRGSARSRSPRVDRCNAGRIEQPHARGETGGCGP